MSGGDGGPVAYQGSHGWMFGNQAYVWTLFRKNYSNYEFGETVIVTNSAALKIISPLFCDDK